MNDLLSTSCIKGTDYVNLRQNNMRDLEMGDMDATEDITLKAFFEDVNFIKTDMEKTKQLLFKVQAANEEGKTIHKPHIMKALRQRMDKDILEILKRAKSIQANLEELDKANMSNRSHSGCEQGTPVDRTRISITNSLRQKLRDLMEDFQLLRQQIMMEYKQTVERLFYTVTGQHLDEDTVEQIIKTGESENFLQKVIHEQGRGQVMDTIKELQERHDAAKEIEHNLLDLHQIFLNMSAMVEDQGESLNDIQHHVNAASTYIDHGTQQLKGAQYCHRNNFKFLGLIIVMLLILIMILVVPLTISLRR